MKKECRGLGAQRTEELMRRLRNQGYESALDYLPTIFSDLVKLNVPIALQSHIINIVLCCSKPIKDAWPIITDEALSDQSDFAIRVELLAFFLHIAYLSAYKYRGACARDALQDAITIETVRHLVGYSFARTGDSYGKIAELEHWTPVLSAVANECIDTLNDADSYYSASQGALVARDSLDGIDILTKLALRICHTSAHEIPPGSFRFLEVLRLTNEVAINGFAKSKLMECATIACKTLLP